MILSAVIAVFLCRAVAAHLIIPPWQGPDEPPHFALAKLLTLPEVDLSAARADIETEVIQSMARHHWWELYQETPPDPIPKAFSAIPEHLSHGTLAQPSYYSVAALTLRLLHPSSVEAEYLLLRTLSVVLSVLVLICGWAGTRLLFDTSTAAGATALVALHPQFLLNAISVNPDSLINLCGAVMWWRTAHLYVGASPKFLNAVVILASGVLAATAKRNGVPLLGIALLILTLVFIRTWRQASVRRRFTLSTTTAIASLIVIVGGMWFADPLGGIMTFWRGGFVLRRPFEEVTAETSLRFLATAVDTSWLVAGWLRFPAPEPWLWFARLLSGIGLLGSAYVLFKSERFRQSVLLAWLFTGVTVGALLVVAFVGGSVPQGRYFFGAIIPAAVLIWVGLQQLVPKTTRPRVAPFVLCVIAALDLTGFAMVLIPAYQVIYP